LQCSKNFPKVVNPIEISQTRRVAQPK
jgi:hypothetical protein